MTALVNGKVIKDWLEQEISDGDFKRQASTFRNWITADGSPGPTGIGGFNTESDRYHLYVSLACPWANRTLIFRQLKKLEAYIGVSVVEPDMLEQGWRFADSSDNSYGSTPDHVNEFEYAHQLYTKADVNFTGQVTVPILWDKNNNTIVNNESSEIIRMFNDAFNDFTDAKQDYYPVTLHTEIEEINAIVYKNINNGVYRCGFARSQRAYEAAFDRLFSTLEMLEQRLSRQRYLVGEVLTEADWRLFTTLVRFDAVYYVHFKCNLKRIIDYPNLSNYVRDLFQMPGIAETIHMPHIKRHYYYSHDSINPSRIIAKGPEIDFNLPHDRERFPGKTSVR